MTSGHLLKAFAIAASVLYATGTALAGFTYVSTPLPATTAYGGSNVTLTPVSSVGTLSVPTYINIANVGVTSTTLPPATDTVTISVSDPIAITNVPTPGTVATGTITVTGTLSFTRTDTNGELSTFTPGPFAPSTTIGGVLYTISNLDYSQPTVNNIPSGEGNLSALVSSNVVPEPAIASILTLGAIGLLARRRKTV